MVLSISSFRYFLSYQLCCINCFVKLCLCTLHELFYFFTSRYKDISKEIVLITGGGHGLGRRLALEFVKYKPKHIVLWGRNEEWLRITKTDVITAGVPCSFYICDVSSKEQIYSSAEDVQRTVGDVSILVNNAGTVHGQHIEHMAEEHFEHSLRVNTLAHIWTIKAFLPSMISENHGHIVCMCSTLGLLGLSGTADYTTSKFALTGLMESLMLELKEYSGINTTIVHPYQVDNSMFAGCRVRFPRSFPRLTEERVTKATVTAVLKNKKQIVIPWYFNLVLFFKSFLPVACLYPSLKFLGLHNMMDPLGHKTHS